MYETRLVMFRFGSDLHLPLWAGSPPRCGGLRLNYAHKPAYIKVCFGRIMHDPSGVKADQPQPSLSWLHENYQSHASGSCLSLIRRGIASRPLPHTHHGISGRLAIPGNEMVKRSETRTTVACQPSRRDCQSYVADTVKSAARSARHAWRLLMLDPSWWLGGD